MSGKVYHVTEVLIWALFLISVLWCIMALGGFVARAIVASPRVDPQGIYAGLIKVVCYLIALAVAGIILFKGLSEFGISLVPLITGLGVGGLAVALAARPTIENLIGGLMILADRPYKVGQRIKIKDKDGIVQQIGMRSTKIRMLSGPQLSVPNEEMARAEIENVSRRLNIRRNANITLKIDTPPEKVEKAVDIIRDILKDHEGMDPKRPPRVYFTEFNPDSLNIAVRYWYHPAKLWKARAFGQIVNLKIMQEFRKKASNWPFPQRPLTWPRRMSSPCISPPSRIHRFQMEAIIRRSKAGFVVFFFDARGDFIYSPSLERNVSSDMNGLIQCNH